MKHSFGWTVLVTVLLSQSLNAALVVAPNKYQNLEAGTNNGFPFSAGTQFYPYGSTMRYQQLYDASQFGSAQVAISQIAFRYDSNVAPGAFDSGMIQRIQFDLSTSNKTPANLSGTFADNIGPDDHLVFDGSIDWLSANTGTPRPFDLIVNLQTSFLYDPSKGNLLLDIHNLTGWSGSFPQTIPSMDSVSYNNLCCPLNDTPVLARIFAFDVNAPTGTYDSSGLITAFDVNDPNAVPEPASLWIAGAGFLALVIWSIRRRTHWLHRRSRPTYEEVRRRVFLGLACCAAVPAAFGGPILCPTGTVSNTFGTANLGSTAGICGNVGVSGGVVTTVAPQGAAAGADVEDWTGSSFSDAANGFSGMFASAVKFSHFWANSDSLVRFQYLANFDGDGYVYAILDGSIEVLALHSSNLDIVFTPTSIDPLLFNPAFNTTSVDIRSTGYHDLAFGVVAGCFYSSCLSITTPLDPVGTFTGISLLDDGPPAPPVNSPEPAAAALAGLGLAGLAVKLRNRIPG